MGHLEKSEIESKKANGKKVMIEKYRSILKSPKIFILLPTPPSIDPRSKIQLFLHFIKKSPKPLLSIDIPWQLLLKIKSRAFWLTKTPTSLPCSRYQNLANSKKWRRNPHFGSFPLFRSPYSNSHSLPYTIVTQHMLIYLRSLFKSPTTTFY